MNSHAHMEKFLFLTEKKAVIMVLRIIGLGLIIGVIVLGVWFFWPSDSSSSTTLVPSFTRAYIVYQYEFADTPESENFQCMGMFEGDECLSAIWLVKRVNGEIDTGYIPNPKCCWRCENGGSWCVRQRNAWPGKVVSTRTTVGVTWEASDEAWCDTLTSEDFNDCNQQSRLNDVPEYRYYLDWLIRSYGGSSGLELDDVRLWGSNEEPPIDENGEMTYGQTLCYDDIVERSRGYKYEIYIYCRAHVDKTRSEIYNTIAHEFKHVLQKAERGGDCDTSNPSDESEAENWANEIAPPCN